MSGTEYKSKSVNALNDLYLEWREKLSQGGGMWTALLMEVPNVLQMLDEDEDMRRKVAALVTDMAKAMEDDIIAGKGEENAS